MGLCISSIKEEYHIRRFAPHGADTKSFARSRKLERDLERAQERNRNVSKLLLLGSGNSGKSTVMKQFKIFLKNGFNMEERRLFRDTIWRSVIEAMRILVQAGQDMALNAHDDEFLRPAAPTSEPDSAALSGGDDFMLADVERPSEVRVEHHRLGSKDVLRAYNVFLLQRVREDQPLWEEIQVPVGAKEEVVLLEEQRGTSEDEEDGLPGAARASAQADGSERVVGRKAKRRLRKKRVTAAPVIQWENMTVGRLLQKIWWDPSTQFVYAREEQYFETPLVYFMQNMDRIARADYHPTNEDILMARKRTNGVNILDFEKEGRKFMLIDVGGQKTERRKWLAHFDNVDAVIFVVGLDQYDQILMEDGQMRPQNRLQESMDLFEGMCQSPWFRKSSFILFLNKADLFKIKIKKAPITVWKSDFVGDPHDYDQCIKFIKKKFSNIYHGFAELRRQEEAYARQGRGQKPMGMGSPPDLYPYVTCATDSAGMQFVIQTCQEILLKNSLANFGFFAV